MRGGGFAPAEGRPRLRAGGRHPLWRRKAIEGLLIDAFGPAALRAFDRHYCLLAGRRLLAFAAVEDRVVRLDGARARVGLLGLVTTERASRGRGLGRMLIGFLAGREAARSRPLLLNCGEGVKGFYLGAGFREIAPRAGYARAGRIEWDEDPVLAIGLPPGTACEGVFLGEDF